MYYYLIPSKSFVKVYFVVFLFFMYDYFMNLANSNSSYQAIRKISTFKLIFLSIITFGIYWYIWLWKLITDINNLYPKKYIYRFGWFAVLLFLESVAIYMRLNDIQSKHLFNIAEVSIYFVQLILALQILKNLENYLKNEFSLNVKHNVLGWLILGCFYINYCINRLPHKIKSDVQKQISELKNSD